MTQLIALLALSALSIVNTLGTYWFVFGIWPVSWAAFVAFAVSQMIVAGCLTIVSKQK